MPTIKQANISPEDLAGKSAKRIKIEGFNGHFKTLHFNDNGESNKAPTAEELEIIAQYYPGATVTEIEDEAE